LVVGAEEAEACKGEGKLAVAAVVVYVVRPRWCLGGGTGLLVVVFGRCKRWWQWRGERERERERERRCWRKNPGREQVFLSTLNMIFSSLKI
jgi:hypothetical protein